MAEGYVSNVVCACGCDTYLSRPCVDRGWRYIRGHKPKDGAAAKTPITDRKVVLSSRSFGYADALALADAEMPLLDAQIVALEADAQRVAQALSALRWRRGDVEALQTFAGLLCGKLTHDDEVVTDGQQLPGEQAL